jgi:uncharacterized protein YndB with AHSA1/START domain
MAVNEIDVSVPPETVWDVLADPQAYPAWVVGTRAVADVDEGFPAPGTRFRYAGGAGPVNITDATAVLAAEPARRLVLETRTGALGRARIEIELRARDGGGTHVVLREHGAGGLNRLLQPAGDLVLRGRNRWSLERLRRLAESRA